MALRKMLATALVVGGFSVAGTFVASVPAQARQSAIQALDTDKDGHLIRIEFKKGIRQP